MTLLSSRLKHFGRVERPVQRLDEMGGQVNGWEKVADVWFSLEPATSREKWEASKVSAEITHGSSMFWRKGISTECRIRLETESEPRFFSISGTINVGEANFELRLWLVERPGEDGTNAS